MNYTDEQLKKSLAKMLPEEISYLEVIAYESGKAVCLLQWGAKWNDERNFMVQNTEFLHLCWLVEETLSNIEKQKYGELLQDSMNETVVGYVPDYHRNLRGLANVAHATWKQRVIALAVVKKIEIA